MLQIDCPWCGPRDEIEFTFGGESHLKRPGLGEDVSDSQWADYLFNRANPRGVQHERWLHRYGCRQWFNVARHTVSHRILAVYRLGEAAPEAGDGEGLS